MSSDSFEIESLPGGVGFRPNLSVLDIRTGPVLCERLTSLVSGRERTILDLSNLAYVDWFAFGGLLGLIRNAEGEIRLVGSLTGLSDMIAAYGLEHVLPLHDRLEDAISGETLPPSPVAR